MARVSIAMPKLGANMETGRIAAWTRAVGDKVNRGDVLAAIETDKVTVDMEALASGTLVEIVHDAGTDIPVGDVIGYIEDGN